MSEEERENRKSARFSGFFGKRKSISGVNEFVSKSLKGISKLGASLYPSRSRSTTPMRKRIEGEQNIELTEQELQRRFYDILEIPVGSHKSYTLRISESNPTSAKLVATLAAAAPAPEPPVPETPAPEPHVDTPHPSAAAAPEPTAQKTLLNSFSFKFQSPQTLQTDGVLLPRVLPKQNRKNMPLQL